MNRQERDAALSRLKAGHSVDWKGASLEARSLVELFLELARDPNSVPAITIRNARVRGDIVLEAFGENGAPMRLQIIGCTVEGGLSARQSNWRHLIIAETKLRFIDLPEARFEFDCLIETTACAGWLELRSSRIGRRLSLKGSTFAKGQRDAAVELSEAEIAGSAHLQSVTAAGGVHARRVRVRDDLWLDGSHLAADDDGAALSLTAAEIRGRLQMGPSRGRRFEAAGRLMLDSSHIGSIFIKGARLDGQGHPAIVADNVSIAETLDVSGLSEQSGPVIEATGSLRFGGARIGRQAQIYDAILSAPADALVLYGARIDGDLLIGNFGTRTLIAGGINANAIRIEGRLVMTEVEADGAEAAISAVQAVVRGDLSLWHIRTKGAIRLGDLQANGIHLENLRLQRSAPPADLAGLPDFYAHPSDTLLEMNHCSLRADLLIQSLLLDGGDCRFIGASIGGGVQISGVIIRGAGQGSLIAQAAEIGGGLSISGAPGNPSRLEGSVLLFGLKLASDLTMSECVVGTQERAAQIVLRGATVGGHLTVLRCRTFGEFNVSGAEILGDVHFHSSEQSNPGRVVCDIRGSVIAGKLQWATATRAEAVSARIDGQVTADGTRVGALGWNRVALSEGAVLQFSNMQIEGRLEAEELIADGRGGVILSGTSVPLLADDLDEESDGWGAGRLTLRLDNFAYARLANPSGRNDDTPATVRLWRRAWLHRQQDPASLRPPRHLAMVLRDQGLFEASRQSLLDAFQTEGEARPTALGRGFSQIFGLLFGHGLSGTRAFASLMALWLLGAIGVINLQSHDLLVAPAASPSAKATPCRKQIDPLLFAADVMIPLVDLGQEKRCEIGRGPTAQPQPGLKVSNYTAFGTLETARFLLAAYAVLGWTFISLAIATWSGLFRRGGRE